MFRVPVLNWACYPYLLTRINIYDWFQSGFAFDHSICWASRACRQQTCEFHWTRFRCFCMWATGYLSNGPLHSCICFIRLVDITIPGRTIKSLHAHKQSTTLLVRHGRRRVYWSGTVVQPLQWLDDLSFSGQAWVTGSYVEASLGTGLAHRATSWLFCSSLMADNCTVQNIVHTTSWSSSLSLSLVILFPLYEKMTRYTL
jgi:hypothetical protein